MLIIRQNNRDQNILNPLRTRYKKLSYRWQTARGCFIKLLRYCRTFCQTRKVWLPDGEKNSKICLFVLTWSTNVTDGRTDRQTEEQTPHNSIDRACIASRGKNASQRLPVYLQQFLSYSNQNCKKIAIFTYPGLHFFVCPGDAPVAITQNVA